MDTLSRQSSAALTTILKGYFYGMICGCVPLLCDGKSNTHPSYPLKLHIPFTSRVLAPRSSYPKQSPVKRENMTPWLSWGSHFWGGPVFGDPFFSGSCFLGGALDESMKTGHRCIFSPRRLTSMVLDIHHPDTFPASDSRFRNTDSEHTFGGGLLKIMGACSNKHGNSRDHQSANPLNFQQSSPDPKSRLLPSSQP